MPNPKKQAEPILRMMQRSYNNFDAHVMCFFFWSGFVRNTKAYRMNTESTSDPFRPLHEDRNRCGDRRITLKIASACFFGLASFVIQEPIE